jgi:hypothetical protein
MEELIKKLSNTSAYYLSNYKHCLLLYNSTDIKCIGGRNSRKQDAMYYAKFCIEQGTLTQEQIEIDFQNK